MEREACKNLGQGEFLVYWLFRKKNISDDYYDHFSLFFPPWRQRVVFYFFPSLSRKEAYCHHHLPLKSERTEANCFGKISCHKSDIL